MAYELDFLQALVTTLLVEIPVIILLLPVIGKEKKIGIWRTIGIGIVATGITIPYLRFIFGHLFDYWTMVIGGELFVILVEMLIYRKLLPTKFSRAVMISVVANLASILLGVVIARRGWLYFI